MNIKLLSLRAGNLKRFFPYHRLLLAVFFLLAPLTAFASGAEDFKGMIYNPVNLEPGLVGGGVIKRKAIEIAAAQGYKTIIDLRTPPEGTGAEKAAVEEQGLRYVNIPTLVGGKKQAEKLEEILSDPDAKPAILHCRSGSRVKQVWAAYKKLRRT